MNQKRTYQNSLQKTFFLIFAVIFSGILATNFFQKPNVLVPSIVLAVLLGLMLYRMPKGLEKRLARRYYIVLAVYGAVMLSVQIIFVQYLRYRPMYDIEAIYQNALLWAETGTFGDYSSATSVAGYLYYYPNNLGGVAMLAGIFKLCKLFGIEDTFLAASVVNGLLTVTAICLTSLCAKRLWGVKQAVSVLVLYALSLPFYFAAPVFYTDFLSIVFPILAFYLLIRQQQNCTRLLPSVLYWLAVGRAAVGGMLLKITAGIVLIAGVIWLISRKKWKDAALFGVTTGLVAGVVLLLFQSGIYANHLDKNRAQQQNMPYQHWLMMGLSETGTYNEADLKFARSISDPERRVNEINEEIVNRAEQLGASGVLKLYWQKGARVFGDGTFELDHFLQYEPQRENGLHELLLKDGKYYGGYRMWCDAVFYAVLLLCVLNAFLAAFGRNRRGTCMVPQLCMLGILLFLMVWEANSRYIINFLPMVYLSAVACEK